MPKKKKFDIEPIFALTTGHTLARLGISLTDIMELMEKE